MSAAGIRLAASIAVCVIVVMIILFIMHKFRRHRFLLNIRHGLYFFNIKKRLKIGFNFNDFLPEFTNYFEVKCYVDSAA